MRYYLYKRNLKKAEQILNNGLEEDPDSVELLYDSACLAWDTDNPEKTFIQLKKAIISIKRKLQDNPESEVALSRIVFFYTRLACFAIAEHEYTEAIALFMKNGNII